MSISRRVGFRSSTTSARDEFSYDSSMMESPVRSAERSSPLKSSTCERGVRHSLDDPLARRHAIPPSSTGAQRVRARGSQTVFLSLTGQGLHRRAHRPARRLRPYAANPSWLWSVPLETGNDGSGRGSRDRSGGRIEFSKYRATRGNALDARCSSWKSSVRFVAWSDRHPVAVDDVDVDGELAGALRERLVTFGDLRVALRTQIPNGRGVLDQKVKS